jgi:hypothetical protein
VFINVNLHSLQDKQNEDWSQNNKKRSKYEDDVPEDNSIEKSEELDKSEENKSEEEVEVGMKLFPIPPLSINSLFP